MQMPTSWEEFKASRQGILQRGESCCALRLQTRGTGMRKETDLYWKVSFEMW